MDLIEARSVLENKQTLDVVIPVYNEEKSLQRCVQHLQNFLAKRMSCSWKIIIADNASKDKTGDIGRELERQYERVHYLYIPQKGRGLALRLAWLGSHSDVMCYMDVDLSTDLEALPLMLKPIFAGHIHVATGNRLMRRADIERSLLREITSRGYNFLIKMMFPTRKFTDAQCGFKAITRNAAQLLIPQVENNNWFFDSELLLLAERYGYRIHQVPVRWVEDPESTVKVWLTAWEDVKGLLRVRVTKRQPFRRRIRPAAFPVTQERTVH